MRPFTVCAGEPKQPAHVRQLAAKPMGLHSVKAPGAVPIHVDARTSALADMQVQPLVPIIPAPCMPATTRFVQRSEAPRFLPRMSCIDWDLH